MMMILMSDNQPRSTPTLSSLVFKNKKNEIAAVASASTFQRPHQHHVTPRNSCGGNGHIFPQMGMNTNMNMNMASDGFGLGSGRVVPPDEQQPLLSDCHSTYSCKQPVQRLPSNLFDMSSPEPLLVPLPVVAPAAARAASIDAAMMMTTTTTPMPTPIAPRSFLRIVDSVQLVSDQNLISHVDSVLECLRPLLHVGKRKRSPDDYFDEEGTMSSDSVVSSPSDDESSISTTTTDNRRQEDGGWGGAAAFLPNKRRRKQEKQIKPCEEEDYLNSNTSTDEEVLSPPGSAAACPSSSSTDIAEDIGLKSYQKDLWYKRFMELRRISQEHGTCMIPKLWRKNRILAKWIKRQRYQFKLKKAGKHSTLTDKRQEALEEIGFVWDSHQVAWEEKLSELIAFQRTYGHCNVPSRRKAWHSLSVWVQCQRRQYKLFLESGKRSHINPDRIERLDAIGFVWSPRPKKNAPSTSCPTPTPSSTTSSSSIPAANASAGDDDGIPASSAESC